MNSPRMAYLISKYPAVSHTFILREVLALREQGFLIETASINASPRLERLTETERSEASQTFYIKAQGAPGALRAAAWALFNRPGALLRSLRIALGLAAPDPARMLLCLFYLLEALLLVRWLEVRAHTHLHVHFASQAATVALLATYLAPVTLSITVHGPDEFYDVPGFSLPAKLERARFIACISFFARSQLMKLSPGREWHKFHISRLGVDTQHFAVRAFRAAPGCFEIVCVGRLVPAKGQRILVEALRLLRHEGRSVHLTLIGDGPDRAELERYVSELGLGSAVAFAGAINQDAIQTFYTAADIFALASFAEGIPVVLMEAMAMGIPCVATAINGIPELIRDGIDGLLVAPSHVAGMAAALGRLIDNPALRRTLGEAGRQRVEQEYELGQSARRLAEVFRNGLEPGLPTGAA